MSRVSSFSWLDVKDDRGHEDGFGGLCLAARLLEFHIADTREKGSYRAGAGWGLKLGVTVAITDWEAG